MQAADLAHKTEAGGVLLNIANADAARAAFETLRANVLRAQPGVALDGVLVEKMSKRGLELLVGARRDPRWGPVVVIGLGGTLIEAIGDVRLLPPDLTEEDIVAQFRKLKTARLLDGFRGAPAVDVEAARERGGAHRRADAGRSFDHGDRHQSADGARARRRRDSARRAHRYTKGAARMSENLVTYERDGEIAIVGLNRQDKRNAVNDELMRQLRTAIERAVDEARVGVLFGHGAHFSAGLDLAEAATWLGADQETRRKRRGRWHPVLDVMARGSIPVGRGAPGRVHRRRPGNRVGRAYPRRGRDARSSRCPKASAVSFVGGGGSVRIQRLLGYARMADLMLTGRVLTAAEGERYNLCQYVEPAGQSLERAKSLAARIAKNAPLTNWAIAACLPRVNDASHEDGLFMETLISTAVASEQSQERLKAFIEKRADRLPEPGKSGDQNLAEHKDGPVGQCDRRLRGNQDRREEPARRLGAGRRNSRNASGPTGIRKGRDRRPRALVVHDRRGQLLLVAGHRRPARARTRLLPDSGHRRLLARSARSRARAPPSTPGSATTVLCLLRRHAGAPKRTSAQRHFQAEWTLPHGLMGPPAAFGFISNRYEHQFGLDYAMLGKLAVTQRNHAHPQRQRLREAAQADHGRRLHQLAHDRRSRAAARQRDGVRRRERADRDEPEERRAQEACRRSSRPSAMASARHTARSETLVDVTETGHLVAGQRAFAQAGLTPEDIAFVPPL